MIAISVWLGVTSLVPQAPFKNRDIATGVCLIVFSIFIGVVAGIFGFIFGYMCGFCFECMPECLSGFCECCIYNTTKCFKRNENNIAIGTPVILNDNKV